MATDRSWVIIRPGPLVNDRGTGRVRLETEPFRDQVTRDDVAAVLAAAIADPALDHTIVYLANGEEPIEQAVAAIRA
jgi:hypothetical protein